MVTRLNRDLDTSLTFPFHKKEKDGTVSHWTEDAGDHYARENLKVSKDIRFYVGGTFFILAADALFVTVAAIVQALHH